MDKKEEVLKETLVVIEKIEKYNAEFKMEIFGDISRLYKELRAVYVSETDISTKRAKEKLAEIRYSLFSLENGLDRIIGNEKYVRDEKDRLEREGVFSFEIEYTDRSDKI